MFFRKAPPQTEGRRDADPLGIPNQNGAREYESAVTKPSCTGENEILTLLFTPL